MEVEVTERAVYDDERAHQTRMNEDQMRVEGKMYVVKRETCQREGSWGGGALSQLLTPELPALSMRRGVRVSAGHVQ